MAGVKVKVNGINVKERMIGPGISITHVEMGAKRASIRLYDQLYNINDELKVWMGDNLVFQGDIDKEHVIPGDFTAYASDKLTVLSNEVASHEDHREYVNTEVSVIVKNLLDYYFNGVFDQTNIDTTTATVGYLDLTDKPINECMQILAQRARFVYWLEPPNLFYFKARDSISSNYTAIYGTNVENLAVTRDNFVKTKVIVKMRLGKVISGTGTRIAIVADDTIVKEADAQQLADSILDEMQDIRIRGEITLTELRYDLIPGTTVVLHAPQFGFENETVRIKQITYSPFKTRLVVGVMTAMVEDQIVDFEQRIKRMEDRGLSWVVSCDTSTQTAAGCAGPCEVTCEATCEVTCQSGACQAGVCQSDCQLVQQITCVTEEQTCGSTGTCQVICETGHAVCQSACQTECMNDCQLGDCKTTCKLSCQETCQESCEETCELACQTGCEVACNVGCEVGCNSACQLGCESTCETTCQEACPETTCQASCETSCKVGCQTEALCCGTIGPT